MRAVIPPQANIPPIDDQGLLVQPWNLFYVAVCSALNALIADFNQGSGPHTIILANLSGGGTTGSITWDANGRITSWVDPT